MYRIRNETSNDWYFPVPTVRTEKRTRTLKQLVETEDGGFEPVFFTDEFEEQFNVAGEEVHVPPSLRGEPPGVVTVDDETMDKLKKVAGFTAMIEAGFVSVSKPAE